MKTNPYFQKIAYYNECLRDYRIEIKKKEKELDSLYCELASYKNLQNPRVLDMYNKGDLNRNITIEDVSEIIWNLHTEIFTAEGFLGITKMNKRWHKKQLRKYSAIY